MRELYEQYKMYIIIGGIVAVVIAGYVIFFAGGEEEPALVSEQPAGESGSSQVGRDLLEQLLQLRSITLEAAVFEDPVFDNLRDFGRELSPQPVGRDNPFAPINTGSAPATSGE